MKIKSSWTDTTLFGYKHHIRLCNGSLFTGKGKTYKEAVGKARAEAMKAGAIL